MKFEYMICEHNTGIEAQVAIEKSMDLQGAVGWELVSATQNGPTTKLYYKRQLPDEPVQESKAADTSIKSLNLVRVPLHGGDAALWTINDNTLEGRPYRNILPPTSLEECEKWLADNNYCSRGLQAKPHEIISKIYDKRILPKSLLLTVCDRIPINGKWVQYTISDINQLNIFPNIDTESWDYCTRWLGQHGYKLRSLHTEQKNSWVYDKE